MPRNIPLFWRVFAVNGGLLATLAVLLIVTPVQISAPIKLEQALIIVVGLAITLAANALLSDAVGRSAWAASAEDGDRRPLAPRPAIDVRRDDEVGRVVRAFNRMLDRLESERQQSGRRVLAAQEAERVGIARDLHDEVGQVLTGVLLHLELDRRSGTHASR